MARRQKKPEEGPPAWLTTFGDMNTLLLTFFVFLITTMTIDIKKFNLVLSAFQSAVGVLEEGRTISLLREELMSLGNRPEKLGEQEDVVRPTRVEEMILGWVRDLQKDVQVRTEVTERGVSVLLTDATLFAPGQADLRPSAQPLLNRIATFLREVVPYAEIRVEGHTDDRPIEGGAFRSNMELSAARAASVFSYLAEQNVDSRRMSIAAYGALRPLERRGDESLEEWRARNRRVEIAVLWKKE